MRQVGKILVGFSTIFSMIRFAFCIVGGRNAAIPPFDDPVVFVNHVGRFARVEGFHNPSTGLYTFRGIKYADSPVRENRFLRPRSKRLTGDVDARKNSPPCPQPDYYDERKIIGNEDCLALNIFTPQMPDESTGLPVLIWIHGGGYRYGSAAQYDAEPLSQGRIVFVPIQYRLGTLGILGDGSKEFGGNVAMFDMNAALQWVTEYISFFGGDPRQIKVMGHGSGATSAMHLSSSPMGRSSLNGVVAMSGSSLSQYSHDDNATTTTEEIANAHNCTHKDEMDLLNCLRNKTPEEMVQQDSKLQIDRLMDRDMVKAMNGMLAFSPNIEAKDDYRGLPGIITATPEENLKKEPEKKIPLLIGVSKHETANGINTNEVLKIFKTGTEFLKATANTLRLKSLLNKPKELVGVLGSLGLPLLSDYLTIPNELSPEKIRAKFIEATTDVFFNVPSVMTADLWGKWSSAFFYQFDHVGDSVSSGKQFLKPLPLVSKDNSKGESAHGDELGFLFNVCDVFGNQINNTELKSERDQKARKNFINMIVKFAYMNSSQAQFSLNDQVIAPFRADASHFIKVSEKLSLEKDFRFCQLSLWGAPLKATQKISCEFLSEGLKKLAIIPKPREVPGLITGHQFF